MAESSVACASASRRYTIIPHRGHAAPRRPGQDHRVPEEQRRQEEARVLDVVPEVGSERHVVQRGHMPCPERDDERDPRDARLREDAGEPPHRPRRQHRGHRVPRGKREPRKQRRHRRAQPEQRGRHHHQQQVLDHVRLERPVAQRVDRRAERQEHDAESRRERHRAPGPEALGHARPKRRPAAQVERGGRDHRHDHHRLEAPRERDGLRGPGRRARRPGDSCAGPCAAASVPSRGEHSREPASRRAKHTCSRWRRISPPRRPCSMSSFRRRLKETHLRPLRRRAQRRP